MCLRSFVFWTCSNLFDTELTVGSKVVTLNIRTILPFLLTQNCPLYYKRKSSLRSLSLVERRKQGKNFAKSRTLCAYLMIWSHSKSLNSLYHMGNSILLQYTQISLCSHESLEDVETRSISGTVLGMLCESLNWIALALSRFFSSCNGD